MKVTLLQTDICWGDAPANIKQAEALMDASEDSDLYVLPEMWSTGFATQPEELAHDVNHNEALQWMRSLTIKRKCAISGSLAVPLEDGSYRNRHYFVDGRNQQEVFYDKHHLFMGEEEFFTPGTEKTIVNTLGYKFLPLICFDVRFPEWSRNYVNNGIFDYDCLVYTANFPAPRESELMVLAKARAIENQSYAIVVNRVGTDGYQRDYVGGCAIINPHGEIEAQTKTDKEEILIHSCDFDSVFALREAFPVSKFWKRTE
jgi:predicted amidohydrolase